MVEPGRTARSTEAEDPAGTVVEWVPAALAARFLAVLIDWMLCTLLTGRYADPLRGWWYPVIAFIFEYGFFLGLFGQTPGMWVAKIRCVRFADGGVLGIPLAVLRAVLSVLIVPVLVMDRDRRGVHDRVVGSVVIAAPRPPR